MHFKKLDLVGFKSFSEKTTLHFEPGITAVVGPNGCGKSNIFDSIRWVLGEQSAKSLRGAEMQDIIFNGSDTKEPVGMAEVSLTFDNKTRFLNLDSDEVMISRRIFRSGESEYLLNKSLVRLKDILDLFLGTGIGAESYSIIAQGKIDLVLSSRPEDRRLVFDEAAGITKYKVQKRETLRKLEDTEQNLLRVNDIVLEVKRQIASLERQANKARKYKEIFEELKLKEINLSLLEKARLLEQRDKLKMELNGLQLRETELSNLLKEEENKISNRESELNALQENIMSIRNKILNLENLTHRNKEQIDFNREKLLELADNKKYLEEQIEQLKARLAQDEEKLNKQRQEHADLSGHIGQKSQVLSQKESEIETIAASIKNSLEIIAKAKNQVMDVAARIAKAKNEISDFNAKLQIYLARKKRLEIEKAKVFEERAIAQDSLNKISVEVEGLKKIGEELNLKISSLKEELGLESSSLNNTVSEITNLERQRLSLESHKEFLEKLRTKYEDISESMTATVYLDRLPAEKISGLVIKVKSCVSLNDEDKSYFDPANIKVSGEAKPMELDTQKIEEKLKVLEMNLDTLKSQKLAKEAKLEELNKALESLVHDLRNQEINLANKENSYSTTLEQFNKIKEEEDIIVLELTEAQKEISVLEDNLTHCHSHLVNLNKEHQDAQDSILKEDNNISTNGKLREEVLVVIIQTKTELEALNKRKTSDSDTLKILEETYKQDNDGLLNAERQASDILRKKESMNSQIRESEEKISEFSKDIQDQHNLLKESEIRYEEESKGSGDVLKRIEENRRELDELKDKLYGLQMQDKEIDYKYAQVKDRMLLSYKVDIELEQLAMQDIDCNIVSGEVEGLRKKLDSLGTVNLVAIEEYDELKKRYDFLIQQQNDLTSAKESLHEAISKINRTTKQLFMETFEKVRNEFRNYFRLLFNGGDAQVFLIDEHDPLESGIEIICRPPGKKLQNVLLLSGGEKSLSAIALIFAIFKVKPSPFCILDEIDAALDEANIDRFSRALQEFSKTSQFIVITHNKRTIANANVMYGITMQQSGVSKIVSVKFADTPVRQKDKEPDTALPEPV
ncbi:MAG: AAA family ATPase [Candidatus Omnitrophica bacterium]|nr:AAA family ATPase [Candidatus Omnitrophota bacterium]